MKRNAKIVIVHGLPATGKTTLAESLAASLDLPLLSRDGVKVVLLDALGWGDRDWSQRIGMASFKMLDYVMDAQFRAGASFLVESNFAPEHDNAKFRDWQHRHSGTFVQVILRASDAVIIERFRERAATDPRHPSHTEGEAGITNLEASLARGYEALDVPGPVINVDTTNLQDVNFADVTDQVRNYLTGGTLPPTSSTSEARL